MARRGSEQMHAAAGLLISRDPWFSHHPKIDQGSFEKRARGANFPDISHFMFERGQ
jgi:hypothetical protein